MKKEALGEIFNSTDGLIEVYSDLDFNLASKEATFIAYGTDVPVTLLLYRILDIGWFDLKLYKTSDPFASMLKGKKIIWRKGKWYI